MGNPEKRKEYGVLWRRGGGRDFSGAREMVVCLVYKRR